jgi:type IV fimbrial biogenesis protein FimT
MKLLRTSSVKIPQHQFGFTLVEAMVVVAILAILAMLAAPSFSSSIKRYRVNAIKDDLMSSMQVARSEAIRLGLPVMLIRSSSTAACTVATVEEWNCGWQMVVDSNSNGTISAAELLAARQISTVPIGYDVLHPGQGIQMMFNRWGQAQGVGERFVISNALDGVSGDATITVCISSGGRTRSIKGSATCT